MSALTNSGTPGTSSAPTPRFCLSGLFLSTTTKAKGVPEPRFSQKARDLYQPKISPFFPLVHAIAARGFPDSPCPQLTLPPCSMP
jgi:hypothetical protein